LKFVKNNINVILCFSVVSIASHSSSSASVAKMNLYRILPWMWCFLITSECYNAKNRGEDGSKLIRIDGDIIFGGIFPMHEQVNFFNFSTQNSTQCISCVFLLATDFLDNFGALAKALDWLIDNIF